MSCRFRLEIDTKDNRPEWSAGAIARVLRGIADRLDGQGENEDSVGKVQDDKGGAVGEWSLTHRREG